MANNCNDDHSESNWTFPLNAAEKRFATKKKERHCGFVLVMVKRFLTAGNLGTKRWLANNGLVFQKFGKVEIF